MSTPSRPETLPAALVALVIIASSVLAALHVDLPAFLPLVGVAAAGAAFGVTQATPTAPVVLDATPAPIDPPA